MNYKFIYYKWSQVPKMCLIEVTLLIIRLLNYILSQRIVHSENIT